jgi:hypothetical protein
MLFEKRLNDAALDAAAAAVDEAQIDESGLVRRAEPRVDDFGNLPRWEHVQIQLTFDGHVERHVTLENVEPISNFEVRTSKLTRAF